MTLEEQLATVSYLRAAAVAYATRGLFLVRCVPGDKKLANKGAYAGSVCAPATIISWWNSTTPWNIGLDLGKTGLGVLDIDPKNGGLATWPVLLAQYGPIGPRPTSATPSGGWHFLFLPPHGIALKASAGPGVDVKTSGHICLPPSKHPNGGLYRWCEGAAPGMIAIAPLSRPWLAALAREPITQAQHAANRASSEARLDASQGREGGEGTLPTCTSTYGGRALVSEVQNVFAALQGMRNFELNRSAFKMGQLCSGGEVCEDDARRELVQAAMVNGLNDIEALATFSSGFKAGLGAPRRRRKAR